MSGPSSIYRRERLGDNSQTKKLLLEQLESGVLKGNESPISVQKSHPLFEAQDRNCFRNCWLSLRRDNARKY